MCGTLTGRMIDRVQKLKDARTEAAKEIEAYKAKKEDEFKKFESDVSPHHRPPSIFHRTTVYDPSAWSGLTLLTDSDRTQHSSQTTTSQSSIDSSTKTQLESIESAIGKHKDEVVKKIVERVVKCEPEMHPNLKKVQA